MARFHVRATPPTSPLLFEYGRDFPDFIERLRIRRGDAVAGGCGADRAGMARCLSCRAMRSRWRRRCSPRSPRNGWPIPSSCRIRRRGSCARAFPRSRIFAANRERRTRSAASKRRPPRTRWSRGPALEVVVRRLPPGRRGLSRRARRRRAARRGGGCGARRMPGVRSCRRNIAGMLEAGAFTSESDRED